jgi:hypothetical protein
MQQSIETAAFLHVTKAVTSPHSSATVLQSHKVMPTSKCRRLEPRNPATLFGPE